MYKNKEPIILSKDKIRRTYVTLDTIHTPLVSVVMKKGNKDVQVYAEAYCIASINVDTLGLKHDYATCVCLINHECCYAWSERKRNFIILPDSDLLPADLYWITVFELVYKLKYPQSNNTLSPIILTNASCMHSTVCLRQVC